MNLHHKGAPESAWAWIEPYLPVQTRRGLLHDGEAEATATCVAASGTAVEALKYSLALRFGNAWPIIGYLSAQAGFVDLGTIAGTLTNASGLTAGQLQFAVKGAALAAVEYCPSGEGSGHPAYRTLSSPTQHGLIGFGLERHYGEKWTVRAGFMDYFSVANTTQIRGPSIRVVSAGLTFAF